jgi:glycosyltransferase involved in cell wall biosynthesis
VRGLFWGQSKRLLRTRLYRVSQRRSRAIKILWHSNSPVIPTGYGTQTATWAPRLISLGHEVTISAPSSHYGAPLNWEGVTVLPGWRDGIGNDILLDHYRRTGADLLFTLCDSYALNPQFTKEMNAAHWVPIDCAPLNFREIENLKMTGALPVAMSRFGEGQLKVAGFSPRYIPHAIDITTFSPPADTTAQREAIGLSPDTFVIGINAYNKDVMRKAFAEQFLAFAAFHVKHPDSMLLVHSAVFDPSAVDLKSLAEACGIADCVIFPDQYAYACGMMSADNMASWYGSLDLLSNCSFGEGFGLPIVEAQACGTPVVVTDCSAMSELCGVGRKVPGTKFWVPAHRGWWLRPNTERIRQAYEWAFKAREEGKMPGLRVKAREFALQYDADAVLTEYFAPVLKEIESNIA